MFNTLLYYRNLLNSIPEAMIDFSSLTRIQVETLQLHLAMRKSEINMQDALKTRKNMGISRGTHYRILTQAKKNIRESVFTVAIAVQMGLIKPEDVQKLVSSVSMIPSDLDSERLSEVLALVGVLVSRIVMS
jgi:hypothetical protein